MLRDSCWVWFIIVRIFSSIFVKISYFLSIGFKMSRNTTMKTKDITARLMFSCMRKKMIIKILKMFPTRYGILQVIASMTTAGFIELWMSPKVLESKNPISWPSVWRNSWERIATSRPSFRMECSRMLPE